MSEITPTPRILVVDDFVLNRQLAQRFLEPAGYDLRLAASAAEARAALEAETVDLILLNATLPEDTAFTFCAGVKAQERTRFVPVIMVTALDRRDDRLHGLEAGADDFLLSGVDGVELTTRVRSLLKTKAQHDLIEKQYQELLALEKLRDGLVHLIVHDMRNPLMALMGYLEMLDYDLRELGQEDLVRFAAQATDNSKLLLNLINDLLDIHKMEQAELKLHYTEVSPAKLTAEVLNAVQSLATGGELTLSSEVAEDLPTVPADRELLRRVIQNLVGNAIKFTPRGGTVTVAAALEGSCIPDRPACDRMRMEVRDTGPGIPPEYRDKIFEKFGQVETRQEGHKLSTGLGLTFCKLAVEAHGGEIGVDSVVGEGSTFWFTLPAGAYPAAPAGPR
jgi:signal transduction histidine kinase